MRLQRLVIEASAQISVMARFTRAIFYNDRNGLLKAGDDGAVDGDHPLGFTSS